MGLFRSEVMLRKRIRIPKDNAVEIMHELGKIEDGIEFVDLTKEDIEAKKNFQQLIKRCDQTEKRISNFEKICNDYGDQLVKYKRYSDFIEDLEKDMNNRTKGINQRNYFDLVENEILEDEQKILDLIESYTQINDDIEILIEKKCVLDKSCQLLLPPEIQAIGSSQQKQKSNQASLLSMEEGYSDLNLIAGVIKAEDELRMKRIVCRVSRGRAIPTYFDLVLENKFTKTQSYKKIFTFFFQGGIENVLKEKLLKICDLFNASRYTIPRKSEILQEIHRLQIEISEKKTLLKQTQTLIKEYIKGKIGIEMQPAKYELYRNFFRKERMIYNNLNKCRVHDNFIDGEVWIPEEKFQDIKEKLKFMIVNDSSLTASFTDSFSKDSPPSYFQTNEFTYVFQELTNLYGVPRYREANPSLFNIVTFPFLFGVMFGDIGHGFILFLVAAYLCYFKEDLEKNEGMKDVLKIRYLFLLMGFFAFFNGWMYNDFLSIPLGIFGTCYKNIPDQNHGLIGSLKENCVYPFGLDPKWYSSSNELAFFNSFKMKISVIFGVVQMLLGIVLRGMNNLYFGEMLDFFVIFIPQIIFFTIVFGYMCAMIFIKWSINWVEPGKFVNSPSVITMLMNIFLQGGDVGPYPLYGKQGVQEGIHGIILIVALICIPIILIPKPIITFLRQGKKEHQFDKFEDENHDNHKNNGHEHEEPFGELVIHSGIETIEFVLGSISSTASYLRLWALSLAHAQLAKVLFEKCLLGGIHSANPITIIIGFYIFAGTTFGILMCMDLLECFLHTIRLHWVEFQNKFYKADGYKFNPFCFKYLIDE